MKFKKKIKTVATSVAIAFFLSSVFVIIYYFCFFERVNTYISLINTTAVLGSSEDNSEAKYNFETNKLIKYPHYGKKFATLKIPSIKLSLPVYHGDTLKILRHGVGHYGGSYFPGENGTIILAAHNPTGFFNKLEKVKKGDRVTIEATYATFTYEVYDYKVVKETNLKAFEIQQNEERLIMYTCYPINQSVVGRKTKSYVVYAKRVGDISE